MSQPVWIAERALTSSDDATRVEIALGIPERDPLPGGEWRVAYRVGNDTGFVHGSDAFQTIILALGKIRDMTDRYRPELGWMELSDVGIPRVVPQHLGFLWQKTMEGLIDSEMHRELLRIMPKPGTLPTP